MLDYFERDEELKNTGEEDQINEPMPLPEDDEEKKKPEPKPEEEPDDMMQ